jgi:hydroxyacylglutathione hydrolase
VALEVVTFRRGPFWNFSYLLICTATAEAAVIDPAWDVSAILDAAKSRGARITTAVLTHCHTDHVNGLAELVAATGAVAFAHELEAADLKTHHAEAVEGLSGRERITVGEIELSVLHTPGHSPGSVSIIAEGRAFSGDTLLVGSAGRPGPDGAETLWRSVRTLANLPAGTIVHPGHDEGSLPAMAIGRLVEQVPALRAETLAGFLAALERTTGMTHRT